MQEAFHIFQAKFKHIFIVTNQQGIGKGLMTEQDLQQVHDSMLQQIGVPITRIYYSPFLAKENNIMRKPQIGMALQAKQDYPDVDFNHAVMVGDSESDMQFGINSGMLLYDTYCCIYITNSWFVYISMLFPYLQVYLFL